MMERLIPVISAGVLAISRGIRQYYERLGLTHDAIYLLPVMIDSERYQRGGLTAVESLRNVKFLLNSGSFNEKDGLNHLVQAMAKVREDYPEIKLVFTGVASKSTQEKILTAAGAGAHDWIIFPGFLPRDELIWCYKNALGLLSCRSNSEYANYGFPTKLAEYLSSGRPVIATTVGDVEEYLEDGKTAYLADPENIESIALAIRRLVQDPVKAEKIGRQGAEVARQYFDYRNHAQQVATFIRRRIEAGNPG
jgi:glycosyltransferase involved in cell wall biosynthesis